MNKKSQTVQPLDEAKEFLETPLGKDVLMQSQRWLTVLLTSVIASLLAIAAAYAPSLLNLDAEFASRLSASIVNVVFFVAIGGGAQIIGRTIRNSADGVAREGLLEGKRVLATILTTLIAGVFTIGGSVIPEFTQIPPDVAKELANAAITAGYAIVGTGGVFVVGRSVRTGTVR